MEYCDVPEDVYRENRRKVMLHFYRLALAGVLYPDPYFAALYQEAAAQNIAREIDVLGEAWPGLC
jgi:predicted metal-dependent HD superfamily phosphohydrolase